MMPARPHLFYVGSVWHARTRSYNGLYGGVGATPAEAYRRLVAQFPECRLCRACGWISVAGITEACRACSGCGHMLPTAPPAVVYDDKHAELMVAIADEIDSINKSDGPDEYRPYVRDVVEFKDSET